MIDQRLSNEPELEIVVVEGPPHPQLKVAPLVAIGVTLPHLVDG